MNQYGIYMAQITWIIHDYNMSRASRKMAGLAKCALCYVRNKIKCILWRIGYMSFEMG